MRRRDFHQCSEDRHQQGRHLQDFCKYGMSQSSCGSKTIGLTEVESNGVGREGEGGLANRCKKNAVPLGTCFLELCDTVG